MTDPRIHPSAWAEVARLGGFLRLDMIDEGCYGLTYFFMLDEPEDDDILIEDLVGGCVAISPRAWPYTLGAKIDYYESLTPPRFRVIGAKHGHKKCTCGRSLAPTFPKYVEGECQEDQPMPWRRGKKRR